MRADSCRANPLTSSTSPFNDHLLGQVALTSLYDIASLSLPTDTHTAQVHTCRGICVPALPAPTHSTDYILTHLIIYALAVFLSNPQAPLWEESSRRQDSGLFCLQMYPPCPLCLALGRHSTPVGIDEVSPRVLWTSPWAKGCKQVFGAPNSSLPLGCGGNQISVRMSLWSWRMLAADIASAGQQSTTPAKSRAGRCQPLSLHVLFLCCQILPHSGALHPTQ